MTIKDLLDLQCANANLMCPQHNFIVGKQYEGFDVIMFNSDDMGIFNPMVSDCGRFELSEEEILEQYQMPLWMAKWLYTINNYFIEIQQGL